MDKEINKTHILVLKEQSGSFDIFKIGIEDSSSIMSQIRKVVEDSNKTVFDVQNVFWNNFNCICDYYGYLYPLDYTNTYVRGAIKPQKWTRDEYEKEVLKRLMERLKSSDDKGPEYVKKEKKKIEGNIKEEFYHLCERYIEQQMLYNAFQKAKNDSSVKMYSDESIGWRRFEYDISEDIKICLRTNLGYGCSSYFTLLASYKGIDIAPLSHIAHYYHVNMTDIIKCTRDYIVCRESWRCAFEFVRDFTNNSLTNPEKFVKEYIVKEIDDMMAFLRGIMKNPKAHLRLFAGENPESYKMLCFIRPMSSKDKEFFRVLPHEMSVVFQSEKLKEATDTTEKLKTFSNIHSNVYNYINEISDMAIKLNPEIDKTIDGIQADIDNNLVVHKKEEEERRETFCIQKDTLEKEKNSIGEKLYPTFKENPFSLSFYLLKGIDVIRKFREENREYILLENQHNSSEEKAFEELKKKYYMQRDKLMTIIDELFPQDWRLKLDIVAAIDAINSSEKENPEYIQLEDQFKDICNHIADLNNQISDARIEILNLEKQIFDRKYLIRRLSECRSIFNNYLSNKV